MYLPTNPQSCTPLLKQYVSSRHRRFDYLGFPDARQRHVRRPACRASYRRRSPAYPPPANPRQRLPNRATVSNWIADSTTNVVLTTGGTGFTGRDSTPEALLPLFDKIIEGFGELFRQISYEEIDSSTIQSRAVAGIANATLIFAVPGSTNACATAWDQILHNQLDATFKPCNFAELIPRFTER